MDQFEDVSDGEVDHAFFDSDFEENKKKAEENGECIEKGNTSAALDDPDLVSNSKDPKCCEKESEEKQKDLQKDQPLENNTDNPGDGSSLSVSLVAENAGTSGVTFAASRATQENIPSGIPKIVKEREEDYYTDEEDSSDDGKAQKRNACRNDLLSPKQKFKSALKLAEGKPKLSDYLEESEDTVTDVTPLSTPDISPIQSFELAASNDKKLKIKRQENVNQELYAFLQLEKKEQNLTVDQPSKGTRKNYSFSNDEVRRIDRENQRLLKELSRQSAKPRRTTLKKSAGPPPRLYHTALNRQKEQQRIERENLAFLKRLEAVKPTPGMRRSEQLMDYQRQMSYLSSSPSVRRGRSAFSQLSPSSKYFEVAGSCISLHAFIFFVIQNSEALTAKNNK
uniref:Cilia- and flagella-associated protein 97 n=1 Tax=Calidris pygmaea TaxID=425635 RepID=A0A8C3JA15_9CHAR